MKYSHLFTKTSKTQKQFESRNQTLLQQAGYIDQLSAGVYTFLPLGLMVLQKIAEIIRQEMNAIDSQEMLMPSLVQEEVWQKTGRWDVDISFKTALYDGRAFALGWTHEEVVTAAVTPFIRSYRDLPVSAYQIQNKFRNEVRAKSGIMRGREFMMKDMYSFHRNQEDLEKYYDRVADAYRAVFRRVGIGQQTIYTFADGGLFSKYSHEFQTISEAGEDTIYIDDEKGIAVNQEVYNDEVLSMLSLDKSKLREAKSIEVGNIFKLGTRYSESGELKYTEEDGSVHHPVMGCYGIGLGRVMGTVVETLSDDKGIVWPASIAPFGVQLVSIPGGEAEQVASRSQEIYDRLKEQQISVLWDDRESPAGQLLADAELLGMPVRVVVSHRNQDAVEILYRRTGKTEIVPIDEMYHKVSEYIKEDQK